MKNQIKEGIYLVLDPSLETPLLLEKTRQALEGGVGMLQIWNHWPAGFSLADKKKLIASFSQLSEEFQVPLLINQEWELLMHTELDGVHFDTIPDNYQAIKTRVGRIFLSGITCTNDLRVIQWAEDHQLDYASFCSIFPSPSAGSCDIVSMDTVRRAREITSMPLFLSGGITLENIETLRELDFQGVALISGILKAASPKETTSAYRQKLDKIKHH